MDFSKRWLLFYALLLVGKGATAQVAKVSLRNFAYRCQIPDADCALFPASARLPADDAGSIAHRGRFTPTCQQVVQVEKRLCNIKLVAFASTNPNAYEKQLAAGIKQRLQKYHRQYFGFYDTQHHACLYINFFYEGVEEHPGFVPRWRREVIQVEDGGAGYWSIYYDLDTHTFYKFRHNSVG